MNSIPRLPRSLLLGAVVVAMMSASGCHWVKSRFSSKSDYTQSPESRPLEVPPDLNPPDTSGATAIPAASALGAAASTGDAGFTMADSSTNLWPRIGAALAQIDGVTINGRAEALGSYDVSYQGQSFLIRVEDKDGQSHVFAIGANGQILRAGPASILLATLKTKL